MMGPNRPSLGGGVLARKENATAQAPEEPRKTQEEFALKKCSFCSSFSCCSLSASSGPSRAATPTDEELRASCGRGAADYLLGTYLEAAASSSSSPSSSPSSSSSSPSSSFSSLPPSALEAPHPQRPAACEVVGRLARAIAQGHISIEELIGNLHRLLL
eukprot:GHVT01022526.1.p1 GENE.GHVT01022526.1~~GHVT01022526.1.p1  ORF type:complete len:159 (-),score=67.15 GHVT01022526.1:420-896(-)